jgi:hypothetical protein
VGLARDEVVGGDACGDVGRLAVARGVAFEHGAAQVSSGVGGRSSTP